MLIIFQKSYNILFKKEIRRISSGNWFEISSVVPFHSGTSMINIIAKPDTFLHLVVENPCKALEKISYTDLFYDAGAKGYSDYPLQNASVKTLL